MSKKRLESGAGLTTKDTKILSTDGHRWTQMVGLAVPADRVPDSWVGSAA